MAMNRLFGTLFNSKAHSTGIKVANDSVDISSNLAKIRDTMEILDKKIKYNDKRIAKSIADAIDYKKKNNRTMALRCIRQKRNMEQMQGNLDKQYANLEYQLFQLENLHTNREVVLTMKGVDNTIKNFEKKINVDNIDTLQDDLQESMQTANEITNAISQPLNPMYADNDDLEAELDGIDNDMEQEEFDNKLLEIPEPVELLLPEVPTQPMPKVVQQTVEPEEDETERELRSLMEAMAS